MGYELLPNQATVYVHIYFGTLFQCSICPSLPQNVTSMSLSVLDECKFTFSHRTLTDFTVQDINCCFPSKLSLLCDAGAGTVQTILLSRWLPLSFCQQRSLKGDFKAVERTKNIPLSCLPIIPVSAAQPWFFTAKAAVGFSNSWFQVWLCFHTPRAGLNALS